jgi:hypothetical protein
VVLPTCDRTLPSLLGCLNVTLRRLGGAPTYALTDNEKTVTVEPRRPGAGPHPDVVAAGRYYGMTIRTCVPADLPSKGGAETTVRIAKADLVTYRGEPGREYTSFAELEAACAAFCVEVTNGGIGDRTATVEVLAEEQAQLHVLPEHPVTVTFAQTRRVCWNCTVSVDGVRYSVPYHHVDERVWVRWAADELVVTVIEPGGPREIARHRRGQRGRPQIRDEHYPADHPGRRALPGDRTRRPTTRPKKHSWPSGTVPRPGCRGRRRRCVPGAVEDGRGGRVRQTPRPGCRRPALGTAALASRFSDHDLTAILTHRQARPAGPVTPAE